MGTRKELPPLPCFESVMIADDTERAQFMVQRECNYLQALEGDIDTSHLGFLHMGSAFPDQVDQAHNGRYALINRAPEYHVADTDWGTMYAAYRPGGPNEIYWRFAHFMFPFWTIPPDGNFRDHVIARAWVPMDDTHTMFVHCMWKKNTPGLRKMKDGSTIPGMVPVTPADYLPNTTDWYGRFRAVANANNDYLIDRGLQKTDSFTGIGSIFLQDQAATESMGPIYDRTQERLGTSDQMVIRTRKRLLDAARALRDRGQIPPGVENPAVYAVRSGGVVLPSAASWIEATAELRRGWAKHPDLSRDVLGGVPAV